MDPVTVRFRGLCTHLIANNTWVRGAPPLNILTGDKRRVAIRTFIANSALIGSEIDNSKDVPVHHPAIWFKNPTDEAHHFFALKPCNDSDWWTAPLPRVVLEFDGVSPQPANINQSFTRLPSVWSLTPQMYNPMPRLDALNGFPPHAHAYFDFVSGFSIDRIAEDEVVVTPTFISNPGLIVRAGNTANPGPSIPVNGPIEIWNKPDPPCCSKHDYLLHYFPTTIDLKTHPPEWPVGQIPASTSSCSPVKVVSPEVYCSSSGYP